MTGYRSIRTIALAALAGVAPAFLTGLSCSGGQQQQTAPPVPVVVGRAERVDIPFEIEVIGAVEAFSTVEVNAKVSGELVRVFFEEGQFVQKGEPLFQIDPAPYRAAREGARAALARDSVRARNAEENARRYGELIGKDYITKAQYDQAVAEAAALLATVRANRAALEQSDLNLGYTLIRAPLAGRTGSLLMHEGNNVRAGGEQPLVVIHRLEPIYVRFTAPEQYLTEILERSREGRLAVRVVVPGREDRPLMGELAFIDNMVDEATGTIALKATFPNTDHALWPGQFVEVSLRLRLLENVVAVPSQAVQAGQEGSFVFVLSPDSTVRNLPVSTSYSYQGLTVVDRGLAGGETVVTDGQLRLFPGARVQVTEALGGEAKAGE